MFLFKKKNYNFEDKLYNKILSLSRNKFFYNKIGLSDTYEIRICLIFFHISFLINVIKIKDKFSNSREIMQKIFDVTFKKIDEDMRELGYGDVAVNKKMKKMVILFYNILVNCKNYDNFDLRKKTNLFAKYMLLQSSNKKVKLIELIKYFNEYRSFCFALSINSVIKGCFNFKF